MRVAVLGLALSTGLLVATSPPATADGECHTVYVTTIELGVVQLQAIEVCDGGTATAGEGEGSGTSQTSLIDVGLDPLCVSTAMSLGRDPYEFCAADTDGGEETVQVITPALVATALRRLRPPPVPLQVQPPNGRTLVNFDTNFFVEVGPYEQTIRLLGQPVQVRITPSTYRWQFGDGEEATTDSPGARYPDLDVTHVYRAKGAVSAQVAITYTAEFALAGGPWQPVPGSLTVPSDPVALTVLTATPTLVGS